MTQRDHDENVGPCVCCGHDPACGFASVNGDWLCHDDDHSCYFEYQYCDGTIDLDWAEQRARRAVDNGRTETPEDPRDSGSNDNPHESDGTPPEACTYCGDVWPCAGSRNGRDGGR